MTERSRAEVQVGTYRELESKHRFRETTIFVGDGGTWSSRPGVVDATVFLPRTEYRKGRPEWLFALGRSEVPIRPEFCAAMSPCAVEARVAEEPAEAVPVDAVLVEKPGDQIVMALPAGRYRIEGKDASGKVVRSETIGALRCDRPFRRKNLA